MAFPWLAAATIGLQAGTGIADHIQNQNIADQNYNMQQQQLAWQKNQWYQTKNREDTAVQRRVADLENAGLNKVLASGQGASSASPMQLNAPQNQMKHDKQKIVSDSLGAGSMVMQLIQQKRGIDHTVAQNRLIEEQIKKTASETNYINKSTDPKVEGMNLSNEYSRRTMEDRIALVRRNIEKLGAETYLKQLQAEREQLGINEAEYEEELRKWKDIHGFTIQERQMMALKTLIDLRKKQTELVQKNIDHFKENGGTGAETDPSLPIDVDGENTIQTLERIMREVIEKLK